MSARSASRSAASALATRSRAAMMVASSWRWKSEPDVRGLVVRVGETEEERRREKRECFCVVVGEVVC
jgi:hypothetical protein